MVTYIHVYYIEYNINGYIIFEKKENQKTYLKIMTGFDVKERELKIWIACKNWMEKHQPIRGPHVKKKTKNLLMQSWEMIHANIYILEYIDINGGGEIDKRLEERFR